VAPPSFRSPPVAVSCKATLRFLKVLGGGVIGHAPATGQKRASGRSPEDGWQSGSYQQTGCAKRRLALGDSATRPSSTSRWGFTFDSASCKLHNDNPNHQSRKASLRNVTLGKAVVPIEESPRSQRIENRRLW